MALPSFLQAMFTPQRSGPGQMAWRDIVNEDSGEFSTGDMQEMYWEPSAVTSRSISGPTTRRLPDPLPGTGGGPNPLAQIGRDMGELAGDGGEDMTSISEVMQSFGGPTQDELSVGGGSGSTLGAGLADMETMSAFDAPMTTLASSRDRYAEEGPGMFSQGPSMGTTPRHSNAHGFVGGGGGGPAQAFASPIESLDQPYQPEGMLTSGLTERQGGGWMTPQQSVTQWDKFKNFLAPSLYKGQGISEAPLAPMTPTPGIGVGQTDPATGVPALVGDPNALQNWLASLFERSTTGGAGRGPRVRR